EGVPAGRSGAAPRGAKVKTGGGAGRGGVQVVARARRPTERRSRPAATAGRGPAGRSGAAPHGAGVQTGGDGGGRGGAGRRSRVRRLAGRGFKRAAKAGRGPAGRSGAAERGGATGEGRGWRVAVSASPGRRGRPPLKPLPLPDLGEYAG